MTTPDRKPGRPKKGDTRATRRPRKRGTVGDWRSALYVSNTDPNFVYRWVLSPQERSARILKLLDQGYEFASREDHEVGENSVYDSNDGTSLIRVPDGNSGKYLFLMRIHKDWYEEDQLEKSKMILDTEYKPSQEYKDTEQGEGIYGDFKVTRS